MKKREISIDAIKVLALIFVASVHFFRNTYYYNTNLVGKTLFFQTYLVMFLLVCVPLFIIATGYLQSPRTFTWRHYRYVFSLLGIYFTYSLLAIGVRNIFGNEQIGLGDSLVKLSTFNANPYSWYVNMFLGLYLMIPFLNLLWKHLDKNKRILLIFILGLISLLPSTITPSLLTQNSAGLTGGYWAIAYPLTYYYIGSYIREYRPSYPLWILVSATFIAPVIPTIIEFSSKPYFYDKINSYGSIFVCISAVALFLALKNIQIKWELFRNSIVRISGLTLDIYMASFITDYLIYLYLRNNILTNQQFALKYMLITVPLSFLAATIIAIVRKNISKLLIIAVGMFHVPVPGRLSDLFDIVKLRFPAED